ncbi:VOC family protein [Pseudomonas sp.]|uniref:VOC family protein n=1 Tax=Pseudomonas sp. TaxID=306 RepID=UPI003D0971DE
MTMIDHFSIVVANYNRSKRWYTGALAPLGYELKWDGEQGPVRVAGFGPKEAEQGVLYLISATRERGVCEPRPHFCFRADSREAVQAFHQAGLLAGGEDNGRPGWRDEYGYYAAFVHDPDGYNVEVVCYA